MGLHPIPWVLGFPMMILVVRIAMMVDPLDRELEKIQAQHQTPRADFGDRPAPAAVSPDGPGDNLDQNLEQWQRQFTHSPAPKEHSPSPPPDLRGETRRSPQQAPDFQDFTQKFTQGPDRHPPLDDTFLQRIQAQLTAKQRSPQQDHHQAQVSPQLSRIEAQYQEKKQQLTGMTHEERLAEIRALELEKQRRLKQLTQKAQQWLKTLDPYSPEGMWFNEFAHPYDSRLTAAMEYLEALEMG